MAFSSNSARVGMKEKTPTRIHLMENHDCTMRGATRGFETACSSISMRARRGWCEREVDAFVLTFTDQKWQSCGA